jgi:hypothetical protein
MYMPEAQLLHIPCSHVIVICYELQQFSYHRYVPWYYTKETIRNIWNRTIQGYLRQGTFIENPKENVVHIPNPKPQLCQGVGRRKKKRIRNNMDEVEAGAAVVMCYKCHNTGHTYKRCTTTSYACNAPPTASVGSSATSSRAGRSVLTEPIGSVLRFLYNFCSQKIRIGYRTVRFRFFRFGSGFNPRNRRETRHRSGRRALTGGGRRPGKGVGPSSSRYYPLLHRLHFAPLVVLRRSSSQHDCNL